MKKKQQKLLIVIAIIVVIFVIGFVYLLPDSGQDQTNTIPTHTIPDVTPTEGDTNTETPAIIDKKDLTPEERCETFEDAALKSSCEDNLILKEVLSSGFLTACDDLQVESNLNFCKDSYFKAEAYAKKNASLCENIGDDFLKGQCLNDLKAEETILLGDISACEELTDAALKEKCKNEVAFQTAYKEGNANLCNSITSAALKEICFDKAGGQSDNVNYNKAVEAQDTSLCGNLSPEKKVECLNTVNFNKGVTENNEDACNAVTDVQQSEGCLDIVYKALASSELNMEYCKKINDESAKSSCEQTLNANLLKNAIKKNDVNSCNQITDDTLKNKCRSSF